MACRAAERVGWGRLGNTHRDTEREASRQTLPALSLGVSVLWLLCFSLDAVLFLDTDGETPDGVKETRESLLGKPWT